ncbi:bifunctional phosphopantothenoylcysteine decarboxylase/phosphopantothenate--cysteine ligase CoaBC [Defluviitalea raffinosedens]|uniref:Coenzyme A biosynthesis bifunctional protein CoaBC n=2 Tax=Defluviitalea raffinosedens TaxID=1450156 RepID=A0A7C8LV00_9FIRM|nr:bifunctional phosphopantothenoylcysteine decarboxylase/phosphopantothenate--cysteine ligase CoaBC [Defluviitalea raffinosedens]HHW66763.1 bifunctional phosphopantothenoylcysteine decarboxylase/phosphopantothenate--cysteine ligase CoaBC [Candidatus Epulonipiscium sp.]
MNMSKKTVILGVTGGIAAYKSCEIVSRLIKQDINVQVVMTKSAQEFVRPLVFQSLSNQPVITDMFEKPSSWDIEHISLAQKADLFLIAPATANIIGKVANGIADDMLSTTIMATKAPVVFAPAMNTAMYLNKIVQKNIRTLKELGYYFINPSEGRLACGDVGIGKLADVDVIIEEVQQILNSRQMDYKGKNLIVTAGPTRESIDPVRYISNHSTGKMGYAIAEAAIKRGANVTLITGPTHLTPPPSCNVIHVTTTEEMYHKVLEYFDSCDIVIKAAAPSDYRPKTVRPTKIKKSDKAMTIEFVSNPDILKELGKKKKHQILVGFAAESDHELKYGKEKLEKKNLDMICINNILKDHVGFGHDTNQIEIVKKSGEQRMLPLMTKIELAHKILDEVLDLQKHP